MKLLLMIDVSNTAIGHRQRAADGPVGPGGRPRLGRGAAGPRQNGHDHPECRCHGKGEYYPVCSSKCDF